MPRRGHVGEEREGTLGQVSPWGSREEGIPLEYHEVTVGEGRKSSGMGLVPGWLGLACSLPSLPVSHLGLLRAALKASLCHPRTAASAWDVRRPGGLHVLGLKHMALGGLGNRLV